MDATPLTLLMTRPEAASRRFYAALPLALRAALRPVYAPLIAIDAIEQAVDISPYKGIIFTSTNGVTVSRGLDVPPGKPAYCVGVRTVETAMAGGWSARYLGQSADDLVAGLIADPPPSPLLHLRGVHARGQVSARLSAAGIACDDRVIYDQRGLDLDPAVLAQLSQAPALAPIFSPRTGQLFADQFAGSATLYLAALSEPVADSLRNMKHARLAVARNPSADDMAELLGKLAVEASRVEADGGAQ